jgi:hypothetical protein
LALALALALARFNLKLMIKDCFQIDHMRTVFTQRAPLNPLQGSARNFFDSWRWLNREPVNP